MTNPDFVIPFETATYPTLTCIDDPALVDTPYSRKSWRCSTDASGRAVSGIWDAGLSRLGPWVGNQEPGHYRL